MGGKRQIKDGIRFSGDVRGDLRRSDGEASAHARHHRAPTGGDRRREAARWKMDKVCTKTLQWGCRKLEILLISHVHGAAAGGGEPLDEETMRKRDLLVVY